MIKPVIGGRNFGYMNKALLVIDVQEVFVGENHHKMFDYGDKLVENINKIIDENSENTVVYIYNLMKRSFINKFAPFHLYENTPQAEPAKSLKIISEYKFTKYEGSAFSNPNLDKLLKEKGIDTVEVVGIDGGACVPMTALGAVEQGYKVIVNEKGIGTYKMRLKSKKKLEEKLKKLGAEFIQ